MRRTRDEEDYLVISKSSFLTIDSRDMAYLIDLCPQFKFIDEECWFKLSKSKDIGAAIKVIFNESDIGFKCVTTSTCGACTNASGIQLPDFMKEMFTRMSPEGGDTPPGFIVGRFMDGGKFQDVSEMMREMENADSFGFKHGDTATYLSEEFAIPKIGRYPNPNPGARGIISLLLYSEDAKTVLTWMRETKLLSTDMAIGEYMEPQLMSPPVNFVEIYIGNKVPTIKALIKFLEEKNIPRSWKAYSKRMMQ